MTDEPQAGQRYQRRTIDLHEQHWAMLDALAEALDACPEGGANRGRPSWRALLRLIAEGHYLLTPSAAARMEASARSDQGKWRVRWRKRPATDGHRADLGAPER
jgi:hypothetical protein